MIRKLAAVSLALVLATGASGEGCATSPERGTPVIKTTKKPKKTKRSKGTPAVEMHCFTNAGKRTCTPRARP